MAATGSGDQAIELHDVVADDSQEISDAEKANLVPTDTTAGGSAEKKGTEKREKPPVADSGPPQEGAGGGKETPEAVVPEKLQDDDQLAEIWYKRWFFFFFPKLRRVEERRKLRANDDAYNSQFRYVANKVVTSKYTIITFLPLNLFEQFLRVANAYFLFLVILQAIPTLSSVSVFSTAAPLIGVLSITAIKDAYDDIKRHISDWRVNHRTAHVLNPTTMTLEDQSWQSVRVGSIVRLEKDDFVTADMLLLSSSEPNSLVYIETAELDGETNLKVREPLPVTVELGDDSEKLSNFRGEIDCEPPNNRLHKFVGILTLKNEEQQLEEAVNQYPLDNDKILLRGCRLRNTKWMYGLVIYAGHDTKLVQNSGRTKFKRTHLDLQMNRFVLMILGFLLSCLILCLIGSLIYEFVHGLPFTIYADYYNSAQDHPVELAFLQIFSNLIVLNTFVPISLYVSVEVIRLGQSLLINWDRKMYYEPEDVPAIARTTTLNEELGQIEYIFSDKTGTLTQNVMTFLKCSIGGVKYGDVTQEDKEKEQIVATGEFNPVQKQARQDSTQSASPELEPIDLTERNKYADPNFVFYDRDMIEKCRNGDPACNEFFTLLSLCHTVLPSMESGALQYNAQSPDEAALVAAAKNFGYVFKNRSPFTLTVDMLNRDDDSEQQIELLNILDFNNERKRMSVIVRIDGKIMLYCKGADTIVFARLNQESQPLKKTTLGHLSDYAREGLRTLVLAKRELTVEEYAAFADEYHQASIQQENRDQAVDQVYERIERNLTLMGATAIEDKLQDGVPETIANLAKANIKIWVLTGDKQETAVNIGYSCKLLTEDMRVFIVDEDTLEGVSEQLEEYDRIMDECEQRRAGLEKGGAPSDENNQDDEHTVDESKLGPPFGIVINGHSLRYALKEGVKFQLLETASRCKAVICCRVTPLQKKRVVDLVKKNKDAVTLAIGDGANDVGMIKSAHIGVGISGREGQQAVLASDYSFGQFRYLERLLLVHGRWSYHRMTAFLRYFFYKNFAFAFSQFVFAFFCGFTAQTLYDPTFITVYNVIFTSVPVIALAVLDQDVDENNCYRYPRLYYAGQQNKSFNAFIFVRSLVKGIYVALVLFFVLFGLTFLDFYDEGYEWDYQSFGIAASGGLVLIVNLQIAMDTFHWNPIMHIFVWGSILSWLVIIPITSAPGLYGLLGFFEYLGVAYEVFSTLTLWIYFPIASIIALLPTIIFRAVIVDFDPHIVDDVRLQQKKEGRRLFKRLKFHRKPVDSEVTRRASVKRTGYAYSHTEGFGEMITTGRIFGMNEREVTDERRRRLSTIIGTRRATNPSDGSLTAALFTTVTGVASAVATHGILHEANKKEEKEKKAEINVEIYVEEREDEVLKIDSKSSEKEESKPQEKPSPTQVEDSPVGGELSAPDDGETSDHNSSTAMLIPTTTTNGSSNGEATGGKANLITVQGDTTDDPPASMNLPGSMESPSHDLEEESVREEGTDDDQKLIPNEQESSPT